MKQKIYELIGQRRRQLLVHSYIYYAMDDTIIDDHTYDGFSRELIQLQKDYPDIAKKAPYAADFKDFQMGDSYALPYRNPEIVNSAMRLVNRIDKNRMRGL